MIKPEKFEAQLIDKKNLASSFWYFKLKPSKEIKFVPGQFISVEVGGGEKRFYSIANGDPDSGYLELLIQINPEGLGGKFWMKSKIGDNLSLFGPAGRFQVETGGVTGKVFIATGCGIAPVRSMIEDLVKNKKESGKIRLWWGLREEADLFWINEWESLKKAAQDFEYEVVLSKPTMNWSGKKGHVTDHLSSLELNKEASEVYLCGGVEMVNDVTMKLKEIGVGENLIHFEKY